MLDSYTDFLVRLFTNKNGYHGGSSFFATVKNATLCLSDCPAHSLSDLCKMRHLSNLYIKCVICLTYKLNGSYVRPDIGMSVHHFVQPIHKMRHLSDLPFVRPEICPNRNLFNLEFFSSFLMSKKNY